MTLNQLLADGKLVKHKTSQQEIASLLEVIERDIADASINTLSSDRRFATSYYCSLLQGLQSYRTRASFYCTTNSQGNDGAGIS